MPPPPPDAAALSLPAPPLRHSLGRAHGSVRIPRHAPFWRKFSAFMGPGYLVAVGYMDPGNWATDLAGGSRFGLNLLWVIALSSLMAMLLQALSAKLGIVTGRDLAQACHDLYSAPARIALWLLAEIAIIACDLAEVIGTAIALQLLFHIPLTIGVCLTALNVIVMIALERRGFRKLEMAVVMLMIVVAGCLLTELVLSGPSPASIAAGLVPRPGDLADPEMLFIATGIIGATVMPHNLYLHSAVVQTRQVEAGTTGKQEALRLAILDSVLALSLAMLVNMAILILAASVFHAHGRAVEDIGEAYHLLSPMMGIGAASMLFGLALLASGQNSTLTGTMAGQVVMEGFTRFNMPAWARRALARGLAIIPAMIATSVYGTSGTAKLLIASQVVLSLQLPFAIVPLIRLTSDRTRMGSFANSRGLALLSWTIAIFITAMGAKLLFDIARG